jgi:hypothetical protein
MSGDPRADWISAAKSLTMLAGVAAGAHTPYQIGKSNFGTPTSAIVGISGTRDERREVLTPNARSDPSLIAGRAVGIGANM